MAHSKLYQTTYDRLKKYGLFSDSTLKRVATLTTQQANYETYQAFFKAMGVPLKPILFVNDRGKSVPLVDVAAREPQKGTFVFHLPMGNPLDQNQLYQTAALASAFPAYRVIAFGNPSSKPYSYKGQRLGARQWFRVAFGKNKRAVVSTELDYLVSQGIREAYHVGYSYGALKALLSTQYLDAAHQVKALVLLDPVAHSRPLRQLANDFKTTLQPLGEYVHRSGLDTFLDARQETAGTVNYTAGLLRPVNIAIALMLARTDFISSLKQLLATQPLLRAYVAWGSESELGNDAHMTANLYDIEHETAPGRLKTLRLDGDKHAFANDLPLMAAILYEFLET